MNSNTRFFTFATLVTFLAMFAVAWLGVSDTAHANLSDNLVGEWKLDEGTGTTTADSSPNGNDGIIIREASTSSPAWVSPGHDGIGSALEFDGTGTLGAAANSVNLGDSPTLDGIDNYTMSVWVKFDGPDYVGPGATWANLIGRNAPSTAWAYMLYVHKSGTVRPHHQSEDVIQYYDSVDPIPLGEWTHIEQVADGSNLRLYINGEEDPASPRPYTGTTISVDNANTYIGQDAREFTPLATISEASIYNAALVAPGGVRDGLTTWQKADDDAATGALWEDFYISTNNATQATAANQPTFQANGVNFNPALSFDGDDFMDFATSLGISGTNNFSTFLTTEANTYTGTPVVWGHDGGNEASPMLFYSAGTLSAGVSGGSGDPTCNTSVSTSLPAGVAGIASSIRSNNDTLTLELNGGGTGTGSCSEDFFNYPREIGARASGTQNNLNGLFTEIVHYNRTLSASEAQQVNSYLAIKYGITLDQDTPQDYLASDGATTPWNATEGGVYSNDIAGIGRDDKSLLNQKQSKSVNSDALVTIGHGSIETTNQANTNDFASDLAFLTWGNNGGSTDVVNDIVPVSGTQLKRMERIWKAQETGTVGTVKLQIPQAELSGNTPKMIISNDETFDGTDQQIDLTANGDNYEADITLSDGQFFTFAVDVDIAAPGGVPNNLQLWLKANEEVYTDRSSTTKGTTLATDGQVTQSWGDQSVARTNDATDIDVSLTGPTYRNNTTDNINFNPVLDFSGDLVGYTLEDDFIFSTNSGLSMIAVVAPETAGGLNFVYDFGEAAGESYGLRYSTDSMGVGTPVTSGGGAFATDPHTRGPATTLATGIIDFGTEQELFLDGGTVATDAITTSQLTDNEINADPVRGGSDGGPVTIGGQAKTSAQGGRFFDGRFAEIIVYDEDLDAISANTQSKIESYLALKYGITLGTTASPLDYLASDGTTTFWTGDATYQNGIAGIGRDDTSALNQKQSKSVNDDALVTIGNGTIAATNADNPNDFADDLTFMMWGHNDGSTTTDQIVTNTNLVHMSRVWAVQETGTVGTVKMRIPTAAFASGTPTLLVSNDETFDDTDQQLLMTLNGSDYEADINFTDGQFFTLAVDLPIVITSPAEDVTNNSATLHGEVTDDGEDTVIRRGFVYGTTSLTDPGNQAPETAGYDLIEDETGTFGEEAFNLPVTGLDPDTTYFFRAFAENSGGYDYGDENTFMTGFVAPTVDTLAATSVTQTEATLNGDLTSLGDTTEVDAFFEWREGTSGPFTASTTPETLTASSTFNAGLTTLDPGTIYTFRAVVEWGAGTGQTEGSTVQFTTASLPLPDAPINLDATATGTGQINLSWDAPADDGGSPITGYQIERSIEGGGFSILVPDTGTTDTTYEDTGLDPDTLYTYRVSAITVAGTGVSSNEASATTDAEPEPEPEPEEEDQGEEDSISGGSISSIPPEYLGNQQQSEQTQTEGCEPIITSYIRLGEANDPDQVRRLETFLNDHEGEDLEVDGIYGPEDVAAVNRFQQKYEQEVLSIWGVTEPTGYVYRTTAAKINALACPQQLECPVFTQFNSTTENPISEEVQVTKELLTSLGFYTGTIDTAFTPSLQAALASFQEAFSETMLEPWGLAQGTGYKYKTTNKFLNTLMGCETAPVFLEGVGEFDY